MPMDQASRPQGILWPALPSIVRLQYLFSLPLLIVTQPIVYTFLATLILLVGISLFIVIRSIVRRRRRNRAVHEAWLRYTNGSIPFREGDLDLIRFVEFRMNQAGFTPRSGRIDLSKVPRMWEVNISPKKSIVSEKTAEGKIISSSWKSNQL